MAKSKTPNIDKAIGGFIAFAIQRAKLEIGTSRTIRGRKVRRVSSGDLQRSLFGRTLKAKGKTKVGFGSTVEYADWIHEGVNGSENYLGSIYSFRGQNISELGRENLERWMKQKNIRPRDEDGKFVKPTPARIKGLAFAMGRSIARNGIVGLPFMKLGVEAALKKYDTLIQDAALEDIDHNLSNTFN